MAVIVTTCLSTTLSKCKSSLSLGKVTTLWESRGLERVHLLLTFDGWFHGALKGRFTWRRQQGPEERKWQRVRSCFYRCGRAPESRVQVSHAHLGALIG